LTARHNTYFELRDGLGTPGCVVCRLAARSVRRYLEALAFESVNDLGLRAQLRRSRGFCNLHAWQVLDEAREPFGAGIIYRDVLNACASALAAGDVAGLAGGDCVACQARDASARRYVDALVDHANEAELGRRIEQGGGLCWRHFALALARGGRGLRALARAELAALERVADPSWRPDRAVAAVPTAGVRAGNAAPRRAPDEATADPLVALVVGLRGVHGLTSERSEWDECFVCRVARAAVAAAPTPAPATELCARHAWLAVDKVGAAPVRAALAPALARLRARLDSAADDLARAESVGVGPLSFATPAARRARAELARRLAVDHGCAHCLAQRAAEEAADPPDDAPLCHPHLRGASPATLDHWRALVRDLDDYIRKNDYRFRDEPRGPEQRSPWRAVAAVAGAPGLR
jgi:hypothetical protein